MSGACRKLLDNFKAQTEHVAMACILEGDAEGINAHAQGWHWADEGPTVDAASIAGKPAATAAVNASRKETSAGSPPAAGQKATSVVDGTQQAETTQSEAAERSRKASPSGKATITMTEKFFARPHDIFEALLDEELVVKYTQSKATISRETGGTFSMFDGAISGMHIAITPDKHIAQKWRFNNWPDDAYSTVDIALSEPEPGTTVAQLVQTDVPVQDRHGSEALEVTERGWREDIWRRLRTVLGFNVAGVPGKSRVQSLALPTSPERSQDALPGSSGNASQQKPTPGRTKSLSALPARLLSLKRPRGLDADELFLDNFHLDKRYQTEVMASSLSAMCMVDSPKMRASPTPTPEARALDALCCSPRATSPTGDAMDDDSDYDAEPGRSLGNSWPHTPYSPNSFSPRSGSPSDSEPASPNSNHGSPPLSPRWRIRVNSSGTSRSRRRSHSPVAMRARLQARLLALASEVGSCPSFGGQLPLSPSDPAPGASLRRAALLRSFHRKEFSSTSALAQSSSCKPKSPLAPRFTSPVRLQPASLMIPPPPAHPVARTQSL
eukprot:jgi/Chlat1/2219/Chrsp17S02779